MENMIELFYLGGAIFVAAVCLIAVVVCLWWFKWRK